MFSKYSIKEGNVHNKVAWDVKWNCTGTYLASTSSDKTVKIGQLDTHGYVKTFQTLSRSMFVSRLSWHPSDKTSLALCGDDNFVEIWDVRGNCTANRIPSMSNNINMAWSPDGNFLSIGNKQDNLALLDLRMNRQLKKFKFSCEINEMEWSVNSDHILVAAGEGEQSGVEILEVKVNDEATDIASKTKIAGHTANCTNLTIDRQFKRMATGALDYLVGMWNLDDMICYGTISSFDSSIKSLSFNSCGSHIAVVSGNCLTIYDTESLELDTSIDFKCPMAAALAWHPEKSLLAVGSEADYMDDSSRYRSSDKKQYLQIFSFDSTNK